MRRLLIIYLLILVGGAQAPAQFVQYNHPQLNWQSFDTDHFTVHFHQGTRRTALLVAQIAEDVYPHVTGLYRYQPEDKIHFIIKDTDDYSNGGAFFFDNKVEIWASNLDYIMRGTKNWLRDVVTHEFTHMISIQSMIKTNLTFPYGFLQVFGYEKERRKDVVRGFPNTLIVYPFSSINLPVWFAEGVAQHQANGSRYDYRDPHREMILRDRILKDRMLSYPAMTVFGKSSHGNESAYNLGFSFVNYLSSRFGESVLERITHESAKWNAYTFEGVLEKATSVPAEQLYTDWRDSLTTVYRQRTATIRQNMVRGQAIETRGSANIYPAWSPDGKQIAYLSNKGEDYFSMNKLVLVNTGSGEKRELTSRVTSSLSWSPDGRFLVYSRQDRNSQGSAFNDLYLYDLRGDREIRLTHNLRGSNPDFDSSGRKIVFVGAANGLSQLNVLELAEDVTAAPEKEAWFSMETGEIQADGPAPKESCRRVKFKGLAIRQLLAFKDGRQIYHPRWSGDGRQIVFDTAVEYGRNLGLYDLDEQSFDILLQAEEELRYPFFQPGQPWLYYAASSTGIYNIYRRNMQTGQSELLTNVTGGAMMPSVNKQGDLVYACYDSLGYHIYRINKPAAVDPHLAVYDTGYPASVPKKNFDNTITIHPQTRPYRRTFGKIHILPRLFIDYGTVKPGMYLISSDMLDKYALIAGGAINKDMDYDLYGYLEVREFKPTLFLEVFNLSANIEDVFKEKRGTNNFLKFKRNVNFDLTEAAVGISGRMFDLVDYRASYIFRQYTAKLDPSSAYSPTEGWVYIPTIRYKYLKGQALEWSLAADMIHPDRNKAINASGGRYIFFKHSYERNDFLSGFSTERSLGLEEFTKNYFNQFNLEWEEFFKNPLFKDHALSLHLRAGYIDRKVDDFFHLFAGGLLGMRGYSYFSIEGRHKLITTLTYRFPLWSDMDKLIGHLYFDKLYMGLFYEFGDAWLKSDHLKLTDFKRDVGLQLRLDSFSYSLFPTRFFAEAVYPLDTAENYDGSRRQWIKYPREWRYYFGALYEFDLRERLYKLTRLPLKWF